MPDRLTQLLVATATRVEWPEEVDLRARVRARIAAGPAPTLRPAWQWRVAYAAAALIVIVAGTLVFSPATRRAVADLLGIGGVRITFDGDSVPSPTVGTDYDFGRAVSLRTAQELAGFGIPVLHEELLGDPDAVYFDPDTPPGGQVALVYGARPGLPVTRGNDAAVVFTVFPADLSPGQFFKKIGTEGTRVIGTDVHGRPAYWLEGEPHLFFYEDPTEGATPESVRLVGNVLLWEADGLTLRLEVGDLSLDRALQIAESVASS
ncbi:MAG: hypothetical protein M3161_07680 [Actinomycetota bacterium]|nr:hypothetical protein [Actinomycetota bacterium]